MFLHELEPGTMFKLTDAAVKAEQERLSKRQFTPEFIARVVAGPYLLSLPQRMVVVSRDGRERTIEPEVFPMLGGSNFVPSVRHQYEVEVVPTEGIMAAGLPSRGWIYTSADPEVFLEADGQIIPGFAALPTKKNPGHSPFDGGVFHEDGFQAEFSPEAAQCHETVIGSMAVAMDQMIQHAQKQFPDIRISDKTFVELSPELLASGSDAQVALGCDRSENVWGHASFSPPKAREFPYRMAGGHIHLGTAQDAKWFHSRAERIIRAMDVFLGVPSVALLAGLEDPRRRLYYGRAGEFRYQKHGLEYRVLSNAWIQHPSLAHLVLNLARGAFRLGTTNWEPLFKYDEELVRDIINRCDVAAAQKFVEENARLLIWIMDQDSGFSWGAKALTTIHQGAKKVFGSRLGIHKQWLGHTHFPCFHHFVGQHAIRDFGNGSVVQTPQLPDVPRRIQQYFLRQVRQ